MKKVLTLLVLTASVLFAESNSSASALKILKETQSSATYEAFYTLAQSGDLDAQTLLGEMYLDGVGVAEDYAKAFKWLSDAAKKGDSQAEYLLGYMYENGLYVSADVAKAVEWYTKAAQGGDIMAQYSLALIYKE
ncbi:MAG: sel1 repeat family protein, partial [Sulfurospirillum sp.]